MPNRSARPVVFLDKDGTLIEDVPFNVDPALVRFAPGAADAIALWARHGWRIAIVTNQSGVAHGYFTLADLDRLAAHLRESIERFGGNWAGFYACPHEPTGINEFAIECDCRKPRPGLLQQATTELGVDPADCWFVGDTWSDVAAGRAAGCRTAFVGPTWQTAGTMPADRRPDRAAPDLYGAARLIAAPTSDTEAPTQSTSRL
jgi:histidinol-phosphate phosphatase family protein